MHEERDGLYLLLHSQRPIWTAVNGLGLEIATQCDGSHTVQDIVTRIADRYRQDSNAVYADVVTYLTQLRRVGFLRDEDEPGPTGERLPRSTRLHISVTENCNLRCVHCLVTGGSQKADALSTAEIYRLIDELAPETGDSVTISGGEPLLRKDCLDILRHASNRIRTRLITNATLVDESTAAALAELDITIQISLDGSNPAVHDRIRERGAFGRTMRAAEMLRGHGFAGELTFNVTVMRPNVADVLNVIDLGEQMGVNVYLAPLLKMGRAGSCWSELCLAPDEYARLYTYVYRELPHAGRRVQVGAGLQGFKPDIADQGAWCTIGRGAAVDSSGDVYPCPLLTSSGFHLGNVKQTSLRQIIASPRLQELERFCAGRKMLIAKCRGCHWRNFCQASCPASVLLEKGTMLETDDLCEFRQQLYRDTFFDLAQRKLQRENLAAEQACT